MAALRLALVGNRAIGTGKGPTVAIGEDQLLEIILEAGAEELASDEEHHIITTPPDHLYAVAESLRKAGIEPDNQKLTYQPENSVAVTDDHTAAQVLRLYDALDDCDDVLSVHANFDISDEILAQVH